LNAPLLLMAHPSPDLYGSDWQLLESIDGFIEAGWKVLLVLPADGPLAELAIQRGAQVEIADFIVLRKSLLCARGLIPLVLNATSSVLRIWTRLRAARPTAVYVNTLTIPVWLIAAKLAGVRAICHVHEAEQEQHRVVRVAIALPLRLAGRVVVNSSAARRAIVEVLPSLHRKITILYNGVPGPAGLPVPAAQRLATEPQQLAVVARLSPRKGIDIALDAVGILVSAGRDVELTICGTTYPGYEWYEQELRVRAAKPDLAGRVEFAGYVHPTWSVLDRADAVLIPSRAAEVVKASEASGS